MGCQCSKSPEDQNSEFIYTNNINYNLLSDSRNINKKDQIEENENNFQTIDSNKLNNDEIINISKKQCEEYPNKILSIINQIRENPKTYSDIIKNSIKNIRQEESKDGSDKVRFIYENNLKILLFRGKEAFIEAAEILKEKEPIEPLQFKNEICIPLPEKVEDINNSNYIKEQVKKINEKYHINAFYKDKIIDPDIAVLMMIVDDSTKNPGKKRETILNKKFKYIGISCGIIDNHFFSFFSFSN